MPSATKQELHLAKSLDELKKRSEIPKFGKTNIERYLIFLLIFSFRKIVSDFVCFFPILMMMIE